MRRTVTLAPLAVAAALLVSGCTPDVTRQRVESDVSTTYSHQFDLWRTYQGKRAAHLRPTAECHRSGEHNGDKGPGSWGCQLAYPDPDTGKKASVFEVVLMAGDTCYQGLNPDFNDKPTIRDVHTARTMPNPLFQFDGCLNVYDANKSTTK